MSTSQSHQPYNKKQIYSCKCLIQSQEKSTKAKDELHHVLKQLKINAKVQSLVFKQDSYYVFISLPRVTNDIEIFYSKDGNGTVLAVDTYNLCNFWVKGIS